jgi:hypothetical protein
MISVERAWSRLKDEPMFKTFKLSNFRHIVYNQSFTVPANALVGPNQQDFPGGAIILGITSSARISDGSTSNLNAFRMRHAYGLSFSYSGGETLTPGGPVVAEALLGEGDQTHFPAKELVVAPTQSILTTVQSLDPTLPLIVNIAFHCLVWRFAS